jgi:hypothetical protein
MPTSKGQRAAGVQVKGGEYNWNIVQPETEVDYEYRNL